MYNSADRHHEDRRSDADRRSDREKIVAKERAEFRDALYKERSDRVQGELRHARIVAQLMQELTDQHREFATELAVADARTKLAMDSIVKDDIECQICYELAVGAHQMGCCGKTYCYQCWTIIQGGPNACPSCRHPNPWAWPDLKTERVSKACARPCSFAVQGCRFVGDRVSTIEHERTCNEKYNRI